ncbi:MAG: 4-hydroxyphenylacetate decarboxylase small subunit [Elusimicrobia bacterium]|nr:4-hydroxyphenylacetate decarboxylase small subunit [Elusimicrobiota bacterium]
MVHRDCKNYAPVDVVKGICHLSKNLVPSDGKKCAKYIKLPKCKHCRNYISDKAVKDIGTCKASKNKFMAYADMASAACGDYFEK